MQEQQGGEDDSPLQLFRKGFRRLIKLISPVKSSPVCSLSRRFVCEEENPPIAPEFYRNNFKKFCDSVSLEKSSGTSREELSPLVHSVPCHKPNSSTVVYKENEKKRNLVSPEYMRRKLLKLADSVSAFRKDLRITKITSNLTEVKNSGPITAENLERICDDTMGLISGEKQNYSHPSDQSPLKNLNAENWKVVEKTPEKSCSNQKNEKGSVTPLKIRKISLTALDKENVEDPVEEKNGSVDSGDCVEQETHLTNTERNSTGKKSNLGILSNISEAEDLDSHNSGLNVLTRSKACTKNKALKMNDTDTGTDFSDCEVEVLTELCFEDTSKLKSSTKALTMPHQRRSERIAHRGTLTNCSEEEEEEEKEENSVLPPKTVKLTEDTISTPRSSVRLARKKSQVNYNEEEEDTPSPPKTPRKLLERVVDTPRSTRPRSLRRRIRKKYNKEDEDTASPPKTPRKLPEEIVVTPISCRRTRLRKRTPKCEDSEDEVFVSPPRTPKMTRDSRRLSTLQRTPKTPSTPKLTDTPRTSRLNIKKLTPMIPNGERVSCSPMTPRDKAMMALHVSSAPDSLPCREYEFKTIDDFVTKKIKESSGGVMCIYGNPGIGKTATVERVMKKLQCEAKKKKIKPFNQIEINGMHLTRPKDAYCWIWDKLGNGKVSAKKAQVSLKNRFSSSRSKDDMIVLIIDEFDFLWNKSQDVINDIFEWLICSKLIILAIANTKDILERMKNSKAGDRKVLENSCNLCFNPYSSQQLEEIIKDRLKGNDIFEARAVEFLAKKAACSGDARRALNLCRRVVDIAENGTANISIDILQVSQILQEIQTIPEVIFIKKNLSTHEKLLLKAIRDVLCNSEVSKMSLDHGGIYHQYKALGTLEGNVTILSEMQLLLQVHSLKKKGLIKVSDDSITINSEISLSVDQDYIHMALEPPKNM